MDFACVLQQHNVFEGTTYRISDRLINSRFRYRGFGYNVVTRRNMRKSISNAGCSNSSLVFKGNFDGNLWGSYTCKSLSCSFQSCRGELVYDVKAMIL